MYVAMTRARNHLAVTYPVNVYSTRRGADYSMDQLTRFLHHDARALMQRVVVESHDDAVTPEPAHADVPPVDLMALLRGRFNSGAPSPDKRS